MSKLSTALAPIHESSGSEYPGESPSELEEHAVVHENASFSSEGYDYAQEQQLDQVTARPSTIPRLPIAIKEDSPKVCPQPTNQFFCAILPQQCSFLKNID